MGAVNLIRACVPMPPGTAESVPPHVTSIHMCLNAIISTIPATSGPGSPCTFDSGILGGALDLIRMHVTGANPQ